MGLSGYQDPKQAYINRDQEVDQRRRDFDDVGSRNLDDPLLNMEEGATRQGYRQP